MASKTLLRRKLRKHVERRIIEALNSCQNKITTLNEQEIEAILKMEQKYNKTRKPYYDKRNELISKCSKFWTTAFVKHSNLKAVIADSEMDCLHYLSMLNVEDFEEIRAGYKIEFHFDENPYFENSVLEKEFHLQMQDSKSPRTVIKWKDGMDLTQNNEDKSFFAWFNQECGPESDNIAETIKYDLWEDPLQYYSLPDIEIKDEAATLLDKVEEENEECNVSN